METAAIVFDTNQFKKLFPFYFMVNANMCIAQAGPSFLKLYPTGIAQNFNTILRIAKPAITINSFSNFNVLIDQTVIIENVQATANSRLHGQFEYNTALNSYIFIGTLLAPTVSKIDEHQFINYNVEGHDTDIDLLQIESAYQLIKSIFKNEDEDAAKLIAIKKLVQSMLLNEKSSIAKKALMAEQFFLSNLNHEIRTPLNAIAGMTYLLQDTSVNDEQKEYVDVIQSSTEILLQLVSNILDTSNIETSNIEPSFKEIDIIKLLKGLEKTIRIRHKNNAVKLNFIYPNSANHYVVSDDVIITQILLNILTNASAFTNAGEINLTAELFINHDDIVLLKVVISHTGKYLWLVGQQNTVDKFLSITEQENKAVQTDAGLANTKKLIAVLQGTINIESEEEKGTIFNIVLPLKKGKATIIKMEQHATVEMQEQNFKGCKVLVAEDNELNRKYIGKLLDKWQVDYDFAFDGQEAIDALKKGKQYQLILMDLQMPVKDGIEATIEIRQSNSWYVSIPIIGVSATAIIGLKQQAKAAGINNFVAKPYTPFQLQTAMAQFLQISFVDTSFAQQNTAQVNTNFQFDSQLNAELLKELINDDYEYAKVLFEIFENTILPQIEGVKKAYADNACDVFSKLIHKIKPTFSMVGIPALQELLTTLEIQAAATQNIHTCHNLYTAFLQQLDVYIPIIKNERKRLEVFLNGTAAL